MEVTAAVDVCEWMWLCAREIDVQMFVNATERMYRKKQHEGEKQFFLKFVVLQIRIRPNLVLS